MGTLSFFDETVTSRGPGAGESKCTVAFRDNHSVPELLIGPPGEAHRGRVAVFDDWGQFTRFVESVNSAHDRLKEIRR